MNMCADKLNEMAHESHQNNIQWWKDLTTGERIERNKGALLMLVVTELTEAAEGVRKDLMDDKLPHRKMEEVELADALIRLLDFAGGYGIKIDTSGDVWFRSASMIIAALSNVKLESLMEITIGVGLIQSANMKCEDLSLPLSRVVYIILAYCEKFNLDLEGAYAEKTEFNLHRLDHKAEQRMAPGGKRF